MVMGKRIKRKPGDRVEDGPVYVFERKKELDKCPGKQYPGL